MPLLGRQPELVEHMKEVCIKWLPKEKPDAIVVLSAHWESDPVKIVSSSKPSMIYDYNGFPPETYEYNYPAPGSPPLASKIKSLLEGSGLKSELDDQRGFDHGVFIPLIIMYPKPTFQLWRYRCTALFPPKPTWRLVKPWNPCETRTSFCLDLVTPFTICTASFIQLMKPTKPRQTSTTG
jgi:hypothetical protein